MFLRKRSVLSLLPLGQRSDESTGNSPGEEREEEPMVGSPAASGTPRVQNVVAMNEEKFALLVHRRHEEAPKKLSCRTVADFVARMARRARRRVWQKRTLLELFPCLVWMPSYKKPYLAGDMVAGTTVAILVVPQAISYALLAELPPEVGLQTAIFPVIVYALLGTSRHLHIGPFAVVSLMVGGAVSGLLGRQGPGVTGAPDHEFVAVAAALAATVGMLQLLLGMCTMGSIAILLSDPVVSGVTTAAACFVATSQMKSVFGITVPSFPDPGSIFRTYGYIFGHIVETNVCALIVTVVSVALLLGIRELNLRYQPRLKVPIPGDLIVVILAILFSWGLDLHDRYGLKVIGTVPAGIPPPSLPNGEGVGLAALVRAALPIAIVGYVISVSIVKTFAAQFHYPVDSNQELIALGSANVVGACFGCFPACGSLSRSAVLASTGAVTPFASLISALAMILVVEVATPLFAPLPQAVLAAIILTALRGMLLQYRDALALYRSGHRDALVWLLAFVATLVFNVGLGVGIAVFGNLLIDTYRRSHPQVSELGWARGTTVYRDSARYEGLAAFPGVRILRFNAELSYINRDYFSHSVLAAVDAPSMPVGLPPQPLLSPSSPSVTSTRLADNSGPGSDAPQGGVGAAAVWGASPYNTFSRRKDASQAPAAAAVVGSSSAAEYSHGNGGVADYMRGSSTAESSSRAPPPLVMPFPLMRAASAPPVATAGLRRLSDGTLSPVAPGLEAVTAAAVPASTVKAIAIRFLILDCSPVNDVDSSALKTLGSLHKQLAARGVALLLAAPRGSVRDQLEKSGFTKLCGLRNIFVSVHAAVEHAIGASPDDDDLDTSVMAAETTVTAASAAVSAVQAAELAGLPHLEGHMSVLSPTGKGSSINSTSEA